MTSNNEIQFFGLKAGDRPLKNFHFKLLFGGYFFLLSLIFMHVVTIRKGGYGGYNFVSLIFILVIGWLLAFGVERKYVQKSRKRILSVILLSGVLFVLFNGLGYILPLIRASESLNPLKPLIWGIIPYGTTVSVVFGRLQRPVSPIKTEDSTIDHFQAYFDNNWRMFQTLLSLAVAVVIGVLLPIGIRHVAEWGVALRPLGWFIGGLLSSFVILGGQHLLEIYFLEQAYEILDKPK